MTQRRLLSFLTNTLMQLSQIKFDSINPRNGLTFGSICINTIQIGETSQHPHLNPTTIQIGALGMNSAEHSSLHNPPHTKFGGSILQREVSEQTLISEVWCNIIVWTSNQRVQKQTNHCVHSAVLALVDLCYREVNCACQNIGTPYHISHWMSSTRRQ